MHEFPCPDCGALLRVSEDSVGKSGKCVNCDALLKVPSPVSRTADGSVELPRSSSPPNSAAPQNVYSDPQPDLEVVYQNSWALLVTLFYTSVFLIGLAVIAGHNESVGLLIWIAGILLAIYFKLRHIGGLLRTQS